MRNLKKYGHWYFLGALALAAYVIWGAVFWIGAHRGLAFIYFFDVGQGDAVFIESPGGNQVLIDGGPDDSVLSRLGEVLPFWDRSIDLLVLTHPHADHLDGLLEVLKRYDVGMVLESGVNYSLPEYQEWRNLLAAKGMELIIARAGQRARLDRFVYLDILAPLESFAGKSVKNIHDATVVIKFAYASSTALLTGDAERALERQLIAGGADIDADILKVGHHGSKTSTSEEFLRAVSTDIAVISAGARNRYGHPHQEVLDRLAAFGIAVFRTDLAGNIKFTSNGRGFIPH